MTIVEELREELVDIRRKLHDYCEVIERLYRTAKPLGLRPDEIVANAFYVVNFGDGPEVVCLKKIEDGTGEMGDGGWEILEDFVECVLAGPFVVEEVEDG